MFCPRCGSAHRPGAVFCAKCGARLDGAPVPFPPTRQEAVPTGSIPQPEPMTVYRSGNVFPSGSTPPQPWAPAYAPFPPPAGSKQPVSPRSDPQPPVSEPPARTGRHWPALLAMGILTVLGLVLFYLMPHSSPEPAAPKSCFTVNNGMLTFHAQYYTGGSSLTVPDQIDGQPVIGLVNNCFYGCGGLTEIILPDGLTYIGDYAFAGCDSLRGIFIPEQVTYIGKAAFEGCTELEAICIPASVDLMGMRVFGSCGSLRHVFYSGKFEAWQALCSEYINGSVTIYAEDGAFLHDN